MPKIAVLMNPVSGTKSITTKRKEAETIDDMIDDCIITGLDSASAGEFREDILEVSKSCPHIIIYGGDGTVSDVFNTLHTYDYTFSLIPRGTGNALKYALKLPWKVGKAVSRILNPDKPKQIMDLIHEEKTDTKAYLASVGIDGCVLSKRKELSKPDKVWGKKFRSFMDFFWATTYCAFGGYQGSKGNILTSSRRNFDNLTSAIITKIPYYGMGLKISPKTRMDDGQLHVLQLTGGIPQMMYAATTSYLPGGNWTGYHSFAKHVGIALDNPLYLQMDGDVKYKAKEFWFDVLPKAVTWKV